MKPTKLIMRAFGPYAGTEEIDFTLFDNNKLFLVTGDTGAGKTTIFDAICYAFFGQASGEHRDAARLRSEYAGNGEESYVDFYFSHCGRNYHVYRSPQYEKPSRRGDKTVSVKERAVLYCDGEEPIEGLREVAAAVESLLHINYNQFKQIVMIAQGEFLALLNSKTENRTQILRTVFMTDNYKKMEVILKSRLDECSARLGDVTGSIIQYMNDVTCDESCECKEILDEIKEKTVTTGYIRDIDEMLDTIGMVIVDDASKESSVNEKITDAEKLYEDGSKLLVQGETNNELIDRFERLTQEKEKLESGRTDIDRIRKIAARQVTARDRINPVYSKHKDAVAKAQRTEHEITVAEAEYETALKESASAREYLEECKKQNGRREELLIRAERISSDRDSYAQRDELTVKITDLKKEEQKAEADYDEIMSEKKELADRIEKNRKAVESLKGKKEEYETVKKEYEALQTLLADIRNVTEVCEPEYRRMQRELLQWQEKYKIAKDAYDKAAEERKNAEDIYEACHAGLLAQKLAEGKSCPVCGSTMHPSPAILPDVVVNEAEVDEYKENENALMEEKNAAFAKVSAANSSLNTYEDGLRTKILDCLENDLYGATDAEGNATDELFAKIEEEKTKIVERTDENKERATALKAECENYEKTSDDLEKDREKLSGDIEKRLEKARENKESIARQLVDAGARLKAFETLMYSSMEEAESAREKMLDEIRGIEEKVNDATAADENAQKKKEGSKSKLCLLKDELVVLCEEEKTAEEELLEALKANDFDDTDELLEYLVPEENTKDMLEKIRSYEDSVQSNSALLTQAEKDAKGRQRVDIEELTAELKIKEDALKTVRNELQEVRYRRRNNENIREKISVLKPEYEKGGHEYAMCYRAYKLVKGDTGEGRITLEQYVQATGFDSIIRAANRRLYPMTDGRFELFRQSDMLGRRSNTFLNLEVCDNYTGCKRPVGNLSGGESFKASLSLALGLSDTISSGKGGIQMDALFIDEGFGTLDRKSMEDAMDILAGLSSASKLVGVISHREELIAAIPQQIRVRRIKEGSTLSVDLGM